MPRAGGERAQNSRDRARQLENLFTRDGWFADGQWYAKCHWCKATLTWETATKDRLNPGCLGGRYWLENLVLACYWCNDTRPETYPPEPPARRRREEPRKMRRLRKFA